MSQQELHDFLSAKPVMVLSTVDPAGLPQAAVVAFAVTDDLELIFRTSNTTRKYANLQAQQQIAAVIGWDEAKTVQYEGVVRELDKSADVAMIEAYVAKNPFARKMIEQEDQRFFIVAPSWARYTDISKAPWQVETIKL